MLPEPSRPHRATCHRGAVELAVESSDGFRTARHRDCSFCKKRGAIAVTTSLDSVRIVKGADNHVRYTSNTGTAQHWF